LSEAAVSYDFEHLEPSAPPPGDTPARLLAEATAEAAQIRESAHAEGYAAGIEQGREQALADLQDATRALADALAALDSVRAEVTQAVERDAVELALQLAEKIVAGALQARPELVLDTVQGALRRLGERRRVAVLVNPADLQIVTESAGPEHGRASGIESCEVYGEERVARGSAIVRTEDGEVDASVSAQLERAREVIAAELAAETPQ